MTFGGPYGDGAWSVDEAQDGGYIIAGHTSSRGAGSDLWLIKTDSKGAEEWNTTLGGSGEDVGYSVRRSRDGGFVIAGSTRSYGMGEEHLWLVKVGPKGSKEWDRTFGGFVSSAGDGGWSVDETDEGGYIVAGYASSFGSGAKDLWLIKTDSRGKKQWERTFGGAKDDVGMSVIQARDGGYVTAGRTRSYGAGGDDIWLLKADRSSQELWNRTFGGPKDDVGLAVVEVEDGYVLSGRTESSGLGGKRAVLIKTDLRGSRQWERIYDKDSVAVSLRQAADGGYIVAGYAGSPGAGRDAWLMKTSSDGSKEWDLKLGGPGEDICTSVLESRDGGYVLAGITISFGEGAEDAWLAKVRYEPALPEGRKDRAEQAPPEPATGYLIEAPFSEIVS
jgi:predicted secreted protein